MAKRLLKEIIGTLAFMLYIFAWLAVLLMLKNKGPEFSPLLGLALFIWNSLLLVRYMK